MFLGSDEGPSPGCPRPGEGLAPAGVRTVRYLSHGPLPIAATQTAIPSRRHKRSSRPDGRSGRLRGAEVQEGMTFDSIRRGTSRARPTVRLDGQPRRRRGLANAGPRTSSRTVCTARLEPPDNRKPGPATTRGRRSQARRSTVCPAAASAVAGAVEAEAPFGHLNRNGMPRLAVPTAFVVQGDDRARWRNVRLRGDHAFGLGDDHIKVAGLRIEVTPQVHGTSLLFGAGVQGCQGV